MVADDGDAWDEVGTHLDDDDYETFLAREFDGAGRLRDQPPVVKWIVAAIVGALVLACFLLL
jgi:hypothetical protein